jgi:hypothetical protein
MPGWLIVLTLAIAALTVAARIAHKPSARLERAADRVFVLTMEVPGGIFEPAPSYERDLIRLPVLCAKCGAYGPFYERTVLPDGRRVCDGGCYPTEIA